MNEKTCLAALVALTGCLSQEAVKQADPAGTNTTIRAVASPSLRESRMPYRLGIARYTMWNTPFGDAVAITERIDCHYMSMLEGSIAYDASDADIAAYKAKLAARGITVDTLGPCYFFDEKSIDEVFAFAKRYGMKMISVVPAEKKTVDGKAMNVESEAMIDVLERMVRKYDIKAAIHNHGPESPYMFPTGESIWKRIEKRDRRIGFCFDVGHQARFGGGDPAKFIREHADRIYDVHLKNIKIDPVRNLAKEGPRGELDIPAILKALRDVGFDGVVHIEYEKDHGDNLAPLAESFGYYRGVMDTL